MKKAYTKPEIEVSVFVVEDITTSTMNPANATALNDSFLDIDYDTLFSKTY